MNLPPWISRLLLLGALALAGSACGDSDAGDAAPTSTTAPAPTTEPPAVTTASSTSTTVAATTVAATTTVANTAAATTTPTTSQPTTTVPPTTVVAAAIEPLVVPPGPTTTVAPEQNPCPPNGEPKFKVRPPVPYTAPEVPAEWVQRSVGTSVQGRDIVALVRPAVVSGPAAHQVIVIGSIHGNEVTSRPTVWNMVTAAIPDDVELWLIPDSNPDGTALGVRCNANGVDLNRNFDWEWSSSDGGPAPMSEPETQALADLVVTEAPDLVVWVHQPLDYVSSVGPTDPATAQAWAAASGVPFRDDITQHGGSESWTAFVAGIPSILLEVEARDLTPALMAAHLAGLEAALAALV